jgi:A/G-specific adenine glycosylase
MSATGQVLAAVVARPVPPEGAALAADRADLAGDVVGEAGVPDASPLDVADGAGDVTPGLAAGDVAAPLPYAAAAALPAWPVPVLWDAGFPPTSPEQAQISSPTTPRPPTSAKNRRRQYASAGAFCSSLCRAFGSMRFSIIGKIGSGPPTRRPTGPVRDGSDVQQSCIVMTSPYLQPVLSWYADHARDLPWRSSDASPWSVLVSELMLQQTPVARVLPAHQEWLCRWPTPADLAADPPGEAVRQWGRLGYPRRALWLHAAARTITERHDGEVPASYEALLALPGIGRYTAAAVASFAFQQRHAVLDTNVRRVMCRLVSGAEFPGRTPSAAEWRLAESLLPADPRIAARWSVGMMELGALICTAARPRCTVCPLADGCSWLSAGGPHYAQ